MVDIWDKEKRSKVMANIRDKNTKPELFVRSLLHRHGFRFRLHRKDLPGIPDIVLPKYRSVIFVHGCFWHQHESCRDGTLPKTRRDYWEEKLTKNIKRDKIVQDDLARSGWKVLVLWGCEIEKTPEIVEAKLFDFLGVGDTPIG